VLGITKLLPFFLRNVSPATASYSELFHASA
jgi:hypothetical protein